MGCWRPGLTLPGGNQARSLPVCLFQLSFFCIVGREADGCCPCPCLGRAGWTSKCFSLSFWDPDGPPLVLKGLKPCVTLGKCQQHRLSLCPLSYSIPSFPASPVHHPLQPVPELVPLSSIEKEPGYRNSQEAADCSPLRFWPIPHCSSLVYKIKPFFFQLISFLLEFLMLCVQSLNNCFCALEAFSPSLCSWLPALSSPDSLEAECSRHRL